MEASSGRLMEETGNQIGPIEPSRFGLEIVSLPNSLIIILHFIMAFI